MWRSSHQMMTLDHVDGHDRARVGNGEKDGLARYLLQGEHFRACTLDEPAWTTPTMGHNQRSRRKLPAGGLSWRCPDPPRLVERDENALNTALVQVKVSAESSDTDWLQFRHSLQHSERACCTLWMGLTDTMEFPTVCSLSNTVYRRATRPSSPSKGFPG